MSTDEHIIEHYERPDLVAAIEAGLVELGRPLDQLTIDDVALVDEFHVGGRAATSSFLERLGLEPAMTVLDVGCGLGGAARFAATAHRCTVVGIDLTASYIGAARALTGWLGLDDSVSFQHRAAADLAEAGRRFDAAYLMHVGMNVADKSALFSDIAAVLVPGAPFGIYDLMRTDDRTLAYPTPWATTAETSFVETQVSYESSLAAAGFEIIAARGRHDMAAVFVDTIGKAATNKSGPPPLGLHLLMGPTIGTKVQNLSAALAAEVVTPVELLAQLTS